MDLQVGSIYEGKVTGITKFGAFVSLPGGKSGMVHISEVANAYVDDIHNYLTEGQTVSVKLIGIDQMNRINLSVKRAVPEQPASSVAPPPPPVRSTLPKSEDSSFEDKLRQFMQTSESKMSDLRAGADKRGRRRGR